MIKTKIIGPQEGFQMDFLSNSADIVIAGSGAGCGKSFALLLESLRYIHNPKFSVTFFRRTYPQLKSPGGLWDASFNVYSHVKGAIPIESKMTWLFPSGAKAVFRSLQHEKSKTDYQGSEMPYIFFDETTHFSKSTFFYMLSRNRSTCGVTPRIMATCNPDATSWLKEFIVWWLDVDGFPDPAKNGAIRYFCSDKDNYIWGDTKEEVIEKAWYVIGPLVEQSGISANEFVKSVSFIAGSIYDNKELLKINPGYLGSLNSLDDATKAALLNSNWNEQVSDDDLFDVKAFTDVFTNDFVPHGEKYISADIALKGADKLILMAWDGFRLIDLIVIDKSNGKEVVDHIKDLQRKHHVPNSHVVFDADGIGGYIDGFIPGAAEFHNGGRPQNKENYPNAKTQCYYNSAEKVANAQLYIDESVFNKMFDDKMTIKQRLMYERRAIKRAKMDHDGKLQIIDKSKQKVFLNGSSPDLLDALMMRSYFDFKEDFYIG